MTNRRLLGAIAMVLAIAGGRAASAARQTSSRITPEEIQEALELSADEGAMRRFALRHTLQTRSGIGEGPLLGYVSTPFSRVVLAGAAARKAGTPLTVADVPQDLLSPEFHLVVLPQTAAYSAGESSLLEVVILLRSKPGNAGAPLRTESPNAAQARLYGLARTEGVTVHVFPMTASADFGTVRVSFSQVLRGSTALTNCATCIIPLPRDLR